jgi:hypothetical protein
MARTIGRKNIKLVKDTVKRLTRHPLGQGTDPPSVAEVRDALPSELWDTWEGADSEIDSIIHEAIMNG